MVRHFAVGVDQVRIDPQGAASFYVATNNFPGGGYAINDGGEMTDNRYLVSQGHRSPLSGTDTLQFFGAFGRSAGGTLAFQAFSPAAPSGGIFALRPDSPAALVAQGADWIDLDGALLLAEDRDRGLALRDGLLQPGSLWGGGL